MNKKDLEKGSQLELNESTVLPKISVNYVKFNKENIGIGLYHEINDLPISAIVNKQDGSQIVLDELNSGHPVDNWGKELLEDYFKRKFYY